MKDRYGENSTEIPGTGPLKARSLESKFAVLSAFQKAHCYDRNRCGVAKFITLILTLAHNTSLHRVLAYVSHYTLVFEWPAITTGYYKWERLYRSC